MVICKAHRSLPATALSLMVLGFLLSIQMRMRYRDGVDGV